MKRFLSLLLACAFILIVSSPVIASRPSHAVRRFLVVGCDEAAGNTDVIAVVSYDEDGSRLSLLQIPRDTYYGFGGVQNKLNQLYPYTLAHTSGGRRRELAMSALKDAVSSLLGLPIDRYVAVSISDFSEMIDQIGGVPVNLGESVTLRDADGRFYTLESGAHLLNGREAAAFVRHRIGYKNGDLGRIDAQKVFLSALIAKFGSGIPPMKLLSVLSTLRRDMLTDIPLSLAIQLGVRFARSYRSTEITYLTLPGTAVYSGGISYYAINRASAVSAVARWLCFDATSSEFDPQRRLLSNDPALAEVYLGEPLDYRVYTDAELRPGS